MDFVGAGCADEEEEYEEEEEEEEGSNICRKGLCYRESGYGRGVLHGHARGRLLLTPQNRPKESGR